MRNDVESDDDKTCNEGEDEGDSPLKHLGWFKSFVHRESRRHEDSAGLRKHEKVNEKFKERDEDRDAKKDTDEAADETDLDENFEDEEGGQKRDMLRFSTQEQRPRSCAGLHWVAAQGAQQELGEKTQLLEAATNRV